MSEEQDPASSPTSGGGSAPEDSDKTAVWTPTSSGSSLPGSEEKTMVMPSQAPPAMAPSSSPSSLMSSAPATPHLDNSLTAKFALRFVSRWIDSCLISIVGFSLGMLLGGFSMGGALSAALGFFYFGAAHSWKGQTLGKKLMGLKLVEESGLRVIYKKAFVRALADWLNWVTFGIGYLLILTKRKQPLHDILCKTKVIVVTRRPMWALLAGFFLPTLAWAGFYFTVGVAMFFGPQSIPIKEMTVVQASAPEPVPVETNAPMGQESLSKETEPIPSKKSPEIATAQSLPASEDPALGVVESQDIKVELEKKTKDYIEKHHEIDADSCRDFAILGNTRYRKIVIETSCGEGVGAKMRLIAVRLQNGWRIVRPIKPTESLDPKTGVFRQK